MPHSDRRSGKKREQHSLSGFAGGNNVNGRRCTEPAVDIGRRQCVAHEPSGIDRGQPCAHHGQEVVLEIVEGLGQ
jgi:hypothetical protein